MLDDSAVQQHEVVSRVYRFVMGCDCAQYMPVHRRSTIAMRKKKTIQDYSCWMVSTQGCSFFFRFFKESTEGRKEFLRIRKKDGGEIYFSISRERERERERERVETVCTVSTFMRYDKEEEW